ncbi:MAG: hypothetical protein AAF646_10755 [Pseudomonadota bacterium]
MSEPSIRVDEISYDAAARRYHGAVTFYEPNGTRMLRVSASGHPGWGFDRTVQVLGEAGLQALNKQMG